MDSLFPLSKRAMLGCLVPASSANCCWVNPRMMRSRATCRRCQTKRKRGGRHTDWGRQWLPEAKPRRRCAAVIASRAFSVKTKHHWRKLKWTEVRGVLREAFIEWQTLPDGVQTGNELGLAGGPNDPFPGRLTLWLVGLELALFDLQRVYDTWLRSLSSARSVRRRR